MPDENEIEREPVATDEEGRIVEDVDCRHCGYNLRGLTVEGRCPECMTPVGRSVHGDLLRFCDPDWVERLAAGMRLYVAVIIANIAFATGAGLGLGVSLALTGGIATPLIVGLVMFGAALTGAQVLVYWRITTPDPGRDETEQPVTARAVARIGLVGGSLTGFAAGLLDANKFGISITSTPSSTITTMQMVLATITLAVGLIGMAALFVYAMALARRIPDDALARSTRTVMWGSLITTALMQGTQIISNVVIPGSANPQVAELIFGLVMLAAVLPGLVFLVWGIVLIFKFRNRLVTTAERARSTWAGIPLD